MSEQVVTPIDPSTRLILHEQRGLHEIDVHTDITVVEADRWNGNLDYRFGSPSDVMCSRMTLLAKVGCERAVAMVPDNADSYVDLDTGVITMPHESYTIWPADLQPSEVVFDPDNPDSFVDMPGDGLVTTEPGVGLALYPADCAPLVLYAPGVLALVHIGRRGADMQFAGKVLDHMTGRYGVNPGRVTAYFGPSIAPESYIFQRLDGNLASEAWKPFATPTESGYQIDVVGFARQSLIDYGVPAAQIGQSPVDVAVDPDYYSFTAHKQTGAINGRHGLMVAIKPEA